MSQDKSTRASRAITQPVHYADGTIGSITWVREATVIKRIRRKLAERNHAFVITREGTQARRELGLYAVLAADQTVIHKDADLAKLARFLGVLADDEAIDPPPLKNWRFYIGRYERVIVDGIEANYAAPITKEYTTEAAARKAVEHLTGAERDNLLICSFDMSARIRAAEMKKGEANA